MSIGKYVEHEAERELQRARSQMVAKHNMLVQKARFSLTLQEQKIVLFLVSKIRPKDEDFKYYEFGMAEYCDVCGIDRTSGMNKERIKESIKTLADKSIWVKMGEGDDERETLLRWINKARLYEKRGIIKIQLDEDMKPFLLQLQNNYTQYELLNILAMRSQYSIRLYEFLRSFEHQKKRVYRFDISELKKRLDAEHYGRFPDFRRNVLDIATNEINDLTDIFITYKPLSTPGKGKGYTIIEFTIRLKESLDERMKAWKNINAILNPPQISLFDKD